MMKQSRTRLIDVLQTLAEYAGRTHNFSRAKAPHGTTAAPSRPCKRENRSIEGAPLNIDGRRFVGSCGNARTCGRAYLGFRMTRSGHQDAPPGMVSFFFSASSPRCRADVSGSP